jgi:Flp pilus assembly protein TadD
MMRCSLGVVRRFAFFLGIVALPGLFAAQVSQGSIVGAVRIFRGNFPSTPVMVSLVSRGALVNSIYTDNEGRFWFGQLEPNVYHVVIDEKEYLKVEETEVIDPTSPVRFLTITLTPREAEKRDTSPTISGGNPSLTDPAQYAKQVPKAARHEFEKGVKADQQGKPEDAIRHYSKAVELAPDFYAARNNLGSALLSQSRFPQAQEQFENVIRTNPSDAAAYFNLANLHLLRGELPPAQATLAQGLRREPDSGFGHFLQGSLDSRTGRVHQAESELRRCLELNPFMSKAHLALANLYMQQKRSEDAASELREFLARFPDDPVAPKAKQVLNKLVSGKATP